MPCGILTLTDALFQEAYICATVGDASPDYNSRPQGPDFHPELIPVHSPLLRESYLVSFPPLTYMLKFSGFADLTSCLERLERETMMVLHTYASAHTDTTTHRHPQPMKE